MKPVPPVTNARTMAACLSGLLLGNPALDRWSCVPLPESLLPGLQPRSYWLYWLDPRDLSAIEPSVRAEGMPKQVITMKRNSLP